MRDNLPITILMADDDEEDRMLTGDALVAARLRNPLVFVEDGAELMDYLKRRGKYAVPGAAVDVGLILLDLNMPKMDGREALKAIKSDAQLRHIPVVVLTTSEAEEDIVRSYDLGVNSFIVKPVSFQALVEVVRTLAKYWFEIVKLPGAAGEEAGGHH